MTKFNALDDVRDLNRRSRREAQKGRKDAQRSRNRELANDRWN
jgi:hypothetical protein